MTETIPAPPDATVPEARVFLSYSRKDMAFVDRLEAALKARGIAPLIDRGEIYAFEDWWKRLETLIVQADTVVFVLSPDSVISPVCQKEIEFAESLHKRFAPIVYRRVEDAVVPDALRRLNFVFFDDEARFDANIDRLVDALNTDIDWIRKHTVFGEAARRWSPDGRPGPSGLLLRSPVLEEAERWIASRPQAAPVPTAITQVFVAASRKAATRRRNALTGSLAAGFAIALVLAGLAYWQRGIAVEQRGIAVAEGARAERNFGAAKSTVDNVVFDLAQGLREVEGMRIETVRRILSRAETAVGELAAQTENEPGVRRSQSAMFSMFSDTYRLAGATDVAADYARKSVALARDLLAADPDTGWRHADLANGLERLALTAIEQGDPQAALAAFREGLEHRRAYLDSNKDNGDAWEGLSNGLEKVANLLDATGDLDGALENYGEDVRIMRLLVKSQPDNPKWVRGLSSGLGQYGDVLRKKRDLDAALAAYKESLDLIRSVADGEPDNLEIRRELTMALLKLGDGLRQQRDFAGALVVFRQSLEGRRALAASDADNAILKRGVAIALERVGGILMVQGDIEGGLAALRENLDICRQLVDKAPHNATWQADLVRALGFMIQAGDVMKGRGRVDDALALYREALVVQRSLADASLDDLPSWRAMWGSLTKIGDLQLRAGDVAAARATDADAFAAAAHAADLARDVYAKREDAVTRTALVQVLGDAAWSALLAAHPDKAAAEAEAALKLDRSQAWIECNRAHAYLLLGRYDEAAAIYLAVKDKPSGADRTRRLADDIANDFAVFRKLGLATPDVDRAALVLKN